MSISLRIRTILSAALLASMATVAVAPAADAAPKNDRGNGKSVTVVDDDGKQGFGWLREGQGFGWLKGKQGFGWL